VAKKRIMVRAKLLEISAVDKPAQPDAKVILRKRDEPAEPVAKLKPGKDESQKDFLERFMGDERMKEEYPDQKQRVAVAMSMFRSKKQLVVNEPTPAGSATPTTPAGQETATMTLTPDQIVALQKRLERAEKALSLSSAERELFQKMDETNQDKFLALSTADRLAEIKKANDSNPVIYTDGKGREFRKSDNALLVELAKDADEARKATQASEQRARLERVAKRAADLNKLPGEESDRVLLIEAVEKMEPEQQTKLLALLGKLNSEFAKAFTRVGTSAAPAPSEDSADAKLMAMAKSIREKTPGLTEAQAYTQALRSPEGQALYSQHLDAVHAAARR